MLTSRFTALFMALAKALKMASILLQKHCNGKVVSEIYDVYPKKIENIIILFVFISLIKINNNTKYKATIAI